MEQAKANNHSVREAACACMAELMAKVRSCQEEPPPGRFWARLLAAAVGKLCIAGLCWYLLDAACLMGKVGSP